MTTKEKLHYLTQFLQKNNAYDAFLFYMQNNNDLKQNSNFKKLVKNDFINAIKMAFDWDDTPDEDFWYKLDKKWKEYVMEKVDIVEIPSVCVIADLTNKQEWGHCEK